MWDSMMMAASRNLVANKRGFWNFFILMRNIENVEKF
jgi:hypothetical protein